MANRMVRIESEVFVGVGVTNSNALDSVIHIPFVQNLRVKYYKEEDWICEKKLPEGLA